MLESIPLYIALAAVARFENQLTELLDDAGQAILAKLIESQHEIDDITAMENFILGFRLNVYTHVTDEMRRTAAVKIDQGIGKADLEIETGAAPRKPTPSAFQPHKGQRRKAGTGCVTQINEKLWEGRYSPIWPDGKKHARNVYAHSKEECEKLLADMIAEMKSKIAVEKERLQAEPKAG